VSNFFSGGEETLSGGIRGTSVFREKEECFFSIDVFYFRNLALFFFQMVFVILFKSAPVSVTRIAIW
jgi:hypothetical protein